MFSFSFVINIFFAQVGERVCSAIVSVDILGNIYIIKLINMYGIVEFM